MMKTYETVYVYMYISSCIAGVWYFLATFFEQEGKSNQEQEQTTQLYNRNLPAMPSIIHCFTIHSERDHDLK